MTFTPTPSPSASLGPTASGEDITFIIVDASNGKDVEPLRELVLGATLPAEVSIRADVTEQISGARMKFYVGEKLVQTERYAPYSINGDRGGKTYTPWPLGSGATIRADYEVDEKVVQSSEITFIVLNNVTPSPTVSDDGEGPEPESKFNLNLGSAKE